MIYCGTTVTDEGKEKKVNIDFEPFRPINTSLYLCDNKFHTEVRTTELMHVFNLNGDLQMYLIHCCFIDYSAPEDDSLVDIIHLFHKIQFMDMYSTNCFSYKIVVMMRW